MYKLILTYFIKKVYLEKVSHVRFEEPLLDFILFAETKSLQVNMRAGAIHKQPDRSGNVLLFQVFI